MLKRFIALIAMLCIGLAIYILFHNPELIMLKNIILAWF